MAKRSSVSGKRTVKKPQVKPLQASATKVNIRCVLDANVNIVGSITRTKYKFSGAGSIRPVFQEDVPSLLEKNGKRRTCCGDHAMKIVFEIA